jgi:hypothetical protein
VPTAQELSVQETQGTQAGGQLNFLDLQRQMQQMQVQLQQLMSMGWLTQQGRTKTCLCH